MVHPFVIHIRLTKDCNADCTYCSSANSVTNKFMSSEEVLQSLAQFEKIWAHQSIQPTHITIEYVGGEVSMLPFETLENIILSVRAWFNDKGIKAHDGIQSNLLCSRTKLEKIYRLFEGRIGTSVDNLSDKRRLKGSSHKYRTFFMKTEQHIQEEHYRTLPAVVAIDSDNYLQILDELEIAESLGRSLVFRPVFQGGSVVDNVLDAEKLTSCYLSIFNKWFMRSRIIVNPFMTLLKRRLNVINGTDSASDSFCSWQSDCLKKSLCLEPNGDLYVCQELADHGFGKLGNAFSKEIDYRTIDELNKRGQQIESQCSTCEYYKDCQGGCMMDSVQHGLGPMAKTPYCTAWKALFKSIDEAIIRDKSKAERWIKYLERRNNEQ